MRLGGIFSNQFQASDWRAEQQPRCSARSGRIRPLCNTFSQKHKAHPTPCKNILKPVPDCSEKPGHGGGKRASERRRGAACETRDHARRPLTVMNGALIQAELRREISRRRKLETGTRQRGMATLITRTLEVGAITRGLRRERRRDRGAARARRRERGAERARERWRNREDNAHGEP